MSTSSIMHHPTPYAATAAAVAALAAVAVAAAVGFGSLSLSRTDQPTLIKAPSYGAYPPGGQHPGSHFHPTTAGGRTMIGE